MCAVFLKDRRVVAWNNLRGLKKMREMRGELGLENSWFFDTGRVHFRKGGMVICTGKWDLQGGRLTWKKKGFFHRKN